MKTPKKPKQSTSPRDEGLKVVVTDGRLVISIGVNVLAYAAVNSPSEYLCTEGGHPRFKITHPAGFAEDVAAELDRDNSEGPTPIQRLIEKASEDAAEQGSQWVDDVPSKEDEE